ncbi:MAG: Fic family protein [archaeon]|nr:Fic family protein [archaeon]
MVYLSEKSIKGKKYLYLMKTLRLPNGKVITLQKVVNEKNASPEKLKEKYRGFFTLKEKEAYAKFALQKYSQDNIFSGEQITKIESIKVDYWDTVQNFSKEQHKDVFDRFTANFTYESNAIEGSSLTLKDVAIVMFENRSIDGKDLREIYETKNSREVMEKILGRKFKITEKGIIKMHKMLVKNIDKRTGYKQFPNEIIGSDVKLTLPEKVEEEMAELVEWREKNPQKLHPLQLCALFHGKFEKIHPFADGNGRVGRFIVNAMLVNQDYPPLIIRKTQRDAYIKCLEDFHRGYTKNLERFFLEKYKKTFGNFFAAYTKYIK